MSAKRTSGENPPEGLTQGAASAACGSKGDAKDKSPGGRVPGLGRVLSGIGDVAQLGEHLLCKQGVVGSIPIVSTIGPGAALAACGSEGDARVQSPGGMVPGLGRVWVSRVSWKVIAADRACWPDLVVLAPLLEGVSCVFFVMVNQVLVRLWARHVAFV